MTKRSRPIFLASILIRSNMDVVRATNRNIEVKVCQMEGGCASVCKEVSFQGKYCVKKQVTKGLGAKQAYSTVSVISKILYV